MFAIIEISTHPYHTLMGFHKAFPETRHHCTHPAPAEHRHRVRHMGNLTRNTAVRSSGWGYGALPIASSASAESRVTAGGRHIDVARR
jgi:hypothetical protein